jgi:hypothetical protein
LRWNDVHAFLKTHDDLSSRTQETLGSNLLIDVMKSIPASVLTIAQDDKETPERIKGLGFGTVWKRSFMSELHSVFHRAEDETFDLAPLAAAMTGDVDPRSRILYSDSYREAEDGRFPRVGGANFTRNKRAMLAATLVLTAAGIPMIAPPLL